MKTKDLKELGLTDEQIDSIMKWNGQDVNNAKNGASEETKELQAKVDDLTKQNATLQDQAKQYADYAELKKFKDDTVANADKEHKLSYLKNIGFKHPELLLDKVDFTKGKYDADKKTYTGLDETIKGMKETYRDMFSEPESGNSGANPNGSDNTATELNAVEAAFYANNPGLKPKK